MVDTPKIRALLAQYNIDRTHAASVVGVSVKTFYQKLKTGKFYVDEAEKLANLLGADVRELFFAQERSPDAPNVPDEN